MAAIAFSKSIGEFRALHVYEGTADLSATAIGTAAMAEQDITVTGVLATDMLVSFQPTDAVTFGIASARVKAADTIAVIAFTTDSDTAVDPAGTINYRLIVAPAV